MNLNLPPRGGTGDDDDDDDEIIAQLRNQIADLEVQLAARDQIIAVQTARIADLSAGLVRTSTRLANLAAVWAHPDLSKSEAAVVVAIAEIVDEQQRQHDAREALRAQLAEHGHLDAAAQAPRILDEVGRATVYRAEVTRRTGLSDSTVGNLMKRLHTRGLLEKAPVGVPARIDPATGEIKEAHTECRVKLPASDADSYFRMVIDYHPEPDDAPLKKHGGYRPAPCRQHPDAPITRTSVFRCGECGEVLGESLPQIIPLNHNPETSHSTCTGGSTPPPVGSTSLSRSSCVGGARPARRPGLPELLGEPIHRELAVRRETSHASCSGGATQIPTAFHRAFPAYPAPLEPDDPDYGDDPPPPPPPSWATGAAWSSTGHGTMPAPAHGALRGELECPL